LREFGFTPKGQARSYENPYLEYFDVIPYLWGFRVPDLDKFTGDDAKTTYEHIGQFLAQVNDVGITDVHKIRMFPLSLTVAAFNWFTSLPPNSIDSWVSLEQKFHDYFYNGEVELRLSDLTSLIQKYTKIVSDYLRQFREVRNWCDNLTIEGKDLVDLAFVGLTPYIRDKLDGQEFSDTNQLLQRALPYEDHAKSSRFRDNTNKDKEKHHVIFMDEEANDEEGKKICVVEWAKKPRDKPILCSLLKPNGGWREEMRYTFDLSKCDCLFDLLLRGWVIRLTEGHVIPNADILAKKTYCKWHDSYTHNTNECNYFWRQVQSVINDGRLTLGDGGTMKLNTDLFPVGMVELMDTKVLVCTNQAETTKAKNVVVSNELCNWMIKPHNPKIGVWKGNVLQKLAKKVKLTSAMLIEKISMTVEGRQEVPGYRRDQTGQILRRSELAGSTGTMAYRGPRRRMVQHSTDQESGIRQNP
jgi:hypothetical protein